jgi:hypothetical protein
MKTPTAAAEAQPEARPMARNNRRHLTVVRAITGPSTLAMCRRRAAVCCLLHSRLYNPVCLQQLSPAECESGADQLVGVKLRTASEPSSRCKCAPPSLQPSFSTSPCLFWATSRSDLHRPCLASTSSYCGRSASRERLSVHPWWHPS